MVKCTNLQCYLYQTIDPFCSFQTPSVYSLPDLELKTVDFGKVTIRGEKTKAYVAVNAQGELCVAVSFFQ